MKSSSPTILALWAIALLSVGFFVQQAQAQGPINGNITFSGKVQLDTSSAATATGVILNGWSGDSTLTPPSTIAGAPTVESHDGSFSPFVTDGDGTAFASPWSFNSGPVTNFWSVDGFQFDLLSSTAVQGGTPGSTGFALVTGTGMVSGHGFLSTPATFRFSTQDPGAGNPREFSFSASTSAPEPTALALLGIGGACLITRKLVRRKSKVG